MLSGSIENLGYRCVSDAIGNLVCTLLDGTVCTLSIVRHDNSSAYLDVR